MKKFSLIAAAAVASLIGFGTASAADYPPTGDAKPASSTVAPGGNVVVNITGCQSDAPAEALTATLGTSTAAATCKAAGAALGGAALNRTGTASFTLKAPTAAGTYTGTVLGNQGFSQSFQIQVVGTTPPTNGGGTPGGLPATGSNGVSTMTIIALGLFGVGAGLFGVSQVRRRQSVTV